MFSFPKNQAEFHKENDLFLRCYDAKEETQYRKNKGNGREQRGMVSKWTWNSFLFIPTLVEQKG